MPETLSLASSSHEAARRHRWAMVHDRHHEEGSRGEVTRLPARLQPWWPWFKRAHLAASFVIGAAGRRLGFLFRQRRLPTHAFARAALTAAAEPDDVALHAGPAVPPIRRTVPDGTPPAHWALVKWSHYEPEDLFTLDIRNGITVGDLGAVVTPHGALDFQTSEYWNVTDWRFHPLFLAGRLPRIDHVAGTVAALTTRGGAGSNYHFLFDVLPRLEVLRRCMPDARPDAFHLPRNARYHREILELAGLADLPIVESRPDRAVQAERLLVPSLPNPYEMTPGWIVEWLRSLLPAESTADKPARLYVTRGDGPNTRRLDCEPDVWPELERRGFVRIDPGRMSMRDQIDHFAAADVIVGLHGAALTNLVFCKAGVRVLHLMAPSYVKHCFWAILDAIPDTRYRYLLTEGPAVLPDQPLDGIQDDLIIQPSALLAEVDAIL